MCPNPLPAPLPAFLNKDSELSICAQGQPPMMSRAKSAPQEFPDGNSNPPALSGNY